MPVLNKLEYLDETKQQIKTALNQFGAGITDSDTFRSYVSKIANIHSNWPRITGEGTTLNLNPTKKGKMSLELKGNTEQDGEPTPDNPINVNVVSGDNNINVCGKNLLNLPSSYSIESKTTYKISLKAGTYHITCGEVTKGGANNPVMIWNGTSISLTTDKDATKTLSEDTTLTLEFYSNGWNYSTSQGVTSIVKNLMISSEGGTYEPYVS